MLKTFFFPQGVLQQHYDTTFPVQLNLCWPDAKLCSLLRAHKGKFLRFRSIVHPAILSLSFPLDLLPPGRLVCCKKLYRAHVLMEQDEWMIFLQVIGFNVI